MTEMTAWDLHGLASMPIVPGEQLGGFRIGTNIGTYRKILMRERDHRLHRMPIDRLRSERTRWGEFREIWGLAITLWPVCVHIDVRTGAIHRIETKPGYRAGYQQLTLGTRLGDAERLEPRLRRNEYEEALTIDGVDGIYFGLPESDPFRLNEDDLLCLRITEIGVFDPETGTTLAF